MEGEGVKGVGGMNSINRTVGQRNGPCSFVVVRSYAPYAGLDGERWMFGGVKTQMKGRGCWVGLGWMVGRLVFFELVDAFDGFFSEVPVRMLVFGAGFCRSGEGFQGSFWNLLDYE